MNGSYAPVLPTERLFCQCRTGVTLSQSRTLLCRPGSAKRRRGVLHHDDLRTREIALAQQTNNTGIPAFSIIRSTKNQCAFLLVGRRFGVKEMTVATLQY